MINKLILVPILNYIKNIHSRYFLIYNKINSYIITGLEK